MKLARVLTAMAVAGGVALLAPADATAQQPVPVQEREAIEVTDELIDQFVAVYPEVIEVAQEMQVEMATAETATEAQALQEEGQQRITAVLEEGEMTVAEYEAVVTRLNNDPELLAEVQDRLAEEDGGPNG